VGGQNRERETFLQLRLRPVQVLISDCMVRKGKGSVLRFSRFEVSIGGNKSGRGESVAGQYGRGTKEGKAVSRAGHQIQRNAQILRRRVNGG
jgi:hypothetical protein